MSKILIVEDDANLSRSLKECVERDGYVAEIAQNLAEAFSKINEQTRLVILDWMLPDGQGIDFLTAVRKERLRVPIILLTARAELIDKVMGLEMGANDYVTKPFEPRELLARVRVQLRDLKGEKAREAQPLVIGGLSIDRGKHKVFFKNVEVRLVKKEFELLALFAEHPDRVFSRDEILNKVWGYDVFPTTRTVDTHVMLLRQKIHDQLIETVRSVGYRFRPAT